MGYTGRTQRLCKSGHLSEVDAYEDQFGGDDFCPFCGEEIVWENGIDMTNGERVGAVRPEELKSAIVATCNLGHQHIVEHAVYAIPQGLGRSKIDDEPKKG